MSVLRKKPYIEEAIEAMSENDIATLRAQLNSNTSTLRFSILDLPTVKTISAGTMDFCDGKPEKTGFLVLIPDTIAMFIAYHRFQDLAIFEIDTTNKSFKRINEYCDINELRRVIDDTVEATGDTWVDEMRSVMEKDQDNNVQISDGLYVAGDLQVNGSISGDEIVENMNGYSLSGVTERTITVDGTAVAKLTPIMAKVVKNGNTLHLITINKLTGLVATSNKTGEFSGTLSFVLPENIYNKITSSGTQTLTCNEIQGYVNFSTSSSLKLVTGCYTNTNNRLSFYHSYTNWSWTASTIVYFRDELTILLSDNLIS